MGMGFAPTWLHQVSPPASQNHFNRWPWHGSHDPISKSWDPFNSSQIGTEDTPRHTWLGHHFQGQKVKVTLLTAALTREVGAAVTVRTYWARETTATLRLLGGARFQYIYQDYLWHGSTTRQTIKIWQVQGLSLKKYINACLRHSLCKVIMVQALYVRHCVEIQDFQDVLVWNK